MPRESANTKGLRYLTEARLTVVEVNGTRITATCLGDAGDTYRLGFHGGWHCDCPAKSRCSHLIALQRVVLRPGDTR